MRQYIDTGAHVRRDRLTDRPPTHDATLFRDKTDGQGDRASATAHNCAEPFKASRSVQLPTQLSASPPHLQSHLSTTMKYFTALLVLLVLDMAHTLDAARCFGAGRESWRNDCKSASEMVKELVGLGYLPNAPGPSLGASPGPAPGQTHYGDPLDGPCMTGELILNVTVTGVKGPFCSPQCIHESSLRCPLDKPAGVTATPQCALTNSAGAKYCALICSPSTKPSALRAGDAQCGAKASCKPWTGLGLCTYDE
jgi:hypothetical protein